MRSRIVARASVVALAGLVACGSSPRAGEFVTSCAPESAVGPEPLRIVATVAPITSIVSAITSGTGARVDGIVPEGTNSHTYEPSPNAAASLERADVVFFNGLDLEAPTKRLAAANVADAAVVCELGNEVLPEDAYLFDFSFPESAGSPNPHLWTNPPMTRAYAAVVRDVLSTLDPANTDTYAANDEIFARRIDDLDAAIREATSSIPPERRLLLTYHDAYAYFASEYDWTVVGAIQPSSFNEPTPRDVAALIEQIRSTGVDAIFGSEVFPSPVLRQIAAETGVRYVDDLRDDDLPGDPGDAEHSWFGLMQANLVTIVDALGGDVDALLAFDVGSTTEDAAIYAR